MRSVLTSIRRIAVIALVVLLGSATATSPASAADAPATKAPANEAGAALHKSLGGAKRVVFLGDSITFAGKWVAYVETYMRTHDPNFDAEFIAVGLPSETVSGLSEDGHAGGAFPRPTQGQRAL